MAFQTGYVDHVSDTAAVSQGEKNRSCYCGRLFTCEGKKIAGLLALVAAAALLAMACVLASGVYGGGQTGFIAGGLTIGSMIALGIGVYLIVPRRLNFVEQKL